mmetsp:Transcript_18767/g.40865  ORF Transcript_18767/g.40865 Transcript_18767/m.40865 type:complete len:517 (-) Transcript_18767:113-1663(-)
MRTLIRTYAPLVATLLAAAAAAPVASASNDGVISSLADFEYDDNSRLASHTLVYTEGCADVIEGLFVDGGGNRYDQLLSDRYKLHPVSGEAKLDLFPQGGMLDGSDDKPITANECRAICLERGVDSSLVGAAMPHRHFSGESTFSDWFHNSCRRVEVCFMNYHSKTPMKMMWVTTQGQEKDHGTLKYGERNTKCIDSFLGHRFLFRDGDTNDILLDITVEHTLVVGVGNSPDYTGKDRDFEKEIERTLGREWKRHERVNRTCSPLGFKKGRLPDDIFASMGAFYYNNAKYRVREEWSGKGVFVNWWEVDVYFIQIPWKLKGVWQRRLLDLVAAWTGTELEQTDMYGLRRYEEGARLLTHVDRETTHAFSLIVNVAQGNLSEPWAVEVHDHAHRLHEVTMQPGDIVYYESAKCLHGRNKPLKGKGAYYVNLFTHYRPVGDPAWLDKPNPEGTPEPLIDVGECKLEGSINDVGVGAVKCDDDSIGPYLSPAMFTATSGDDLFNWWKSVGPDAEGHDEL